MYMLVRSNLRCEVYDQLRTLWMVALG